VPALHGVVMTGFGTYSDYERWARDALPASIEQVTVVGAYPKPSEVTVLVRWRPHVMGLNVERSERIVLDYVRERAPVTDVVHVKSVRR
jgi:hypothetical protein